MSRRTTLRKASEIVVSSLIAKERICSSSRGSKRAIILLFAILSYNKYKGELPTKYHNCVGNPFPFPVRFGPHGLGLPRSLALVLRPNCS